MNTGWGDLIRILGSATFLLASAVFLGSSPQPALQIQTREIDERRQNYAIFIKYPEISGADSFNAAVRKILDPLVESSRSEISETGANGPDDPGYLNGSYTANILENAIVSVLLDWSEYVPGAAHPGSGMASIAYDRRTGRVLALSDLFRPGSHYLSRLSRLAIASLDEEEYADHYAIRRGAAPVESNFKVFTLTDTTLVLHFPTYQVAAGAAGPKEVVIPLATLAPLLRKG